LPGPAGDDERLESSSVPYRKATIRPYDAADESVLFTLAKGVFGQQEAWSDAGTMTALESDTVFVAELSGEAAGFVALEQEENEVLIRQLLVSSLHEGEGVGRQLLAYAEGFAISAGAGRLGVVVEADNRRARDFYSGRGFVPAGENRLELTLPQL
jgi:GNAT superfamily N-acetyltransferase